MVGFEPFLWQWALAVLGKKSIWGTGSGSTNSTAGTNQHFAINGNYVSGTEVNKQTMCREGGQYSNLYARVHTNSFDVDVTVHARINGVNSNQVLVIPAGITGEFTDSTNIDRITPGSNAAYRYDQTGGTTGSFGMRVSMIFTPFSAGYAITKMVVGGALVYSTDSTSFFNVLNGQHNNTITTEEDCKTRIRKTQTGKNLSTRVSLNSRTTNSTLIARKNGADGSLSITIPNGVTGVFEDTANSESLVAGDDYCTAVTLGTGGGSLQLDYKALDLLSSAGDSLCEAGITLSQIFSGATARFCSISGALTNTTVEDDTKMDARGTFTFSELAIRLRDNTVPTNPSLVRLRKNGANGNLSISIPAGTTGVFLDSVNNDTVTSSDEVNYSINCNSATGLIDVNYIGVYVAEGAAPPAVIVAKITRAFGRMVGFVMQNRRASVKPIFGSGS